MRVGIFPLGLFVLLMETYSWVEFIEVELLDLVISWLPLAPLLNSSSAIIYKRDKYGNSVVIYGLIKDRF